MTTTTLGREVDAGTLRTLQDSYRCLVKAGGDSVRMAWRFGQCLDSQTDTYTGLQIADAMELSVGTIRRYLRLYRSYQRPELAIQASEQLETYNIDLIIELQDQLGPVEHRTTAGRRFRYRCGHCHSLDVAREEYDPDDAEAVAGAR
jgi:hypothetical protein